MASSTPTNSVNNSKNVFKFATPTKVKSDANLSPSPFESNNGSSKRKKYPFRGNILSPAPKVDDKLLNHLISTEKNKEGVIIGMNGTHNFNVLIETGKLKPRDDKERSKFYNRLYYLAGIQTNEPEEFAELLEHHQIKAENIFVEFGMLEKPDKTISYDNALGFEESENIAPTTTPKVLFRDQNDSEVEEMAAKLESLLLGENQGVSNDI